MANRAPRNRLVITLTALLAGLLFAVTVVSGGGAAGAASAHSGHAVHQHHHKSHHRHHHKSHHRHHHKKHHHKKHHRVTVTPARPQPPRSVTPVKPKPPVSAPTVGQLPLSADQRQYYGGLNSRSMIGSDSGNLVLSAARHGDGYLSSEVDSAPFTYGTVTVRAKLAAGTGMWPAIWLVKPTSGLAGPLGTPEIDMQELPQGQPGKTRDGNFTYHWTDPSGTPWQLGVGRAMPFDLTTGFHTYKLVWLANSITMSVDDIQVMHVETNPAKSTGVFRANAGMSSQYVAARSASIPIYNGPLYLRINNGVGSPGSWAGAPDAATPFPNATVISSIRIDSANGKSMQAANGAFAVAS